MQRFRSILGLIAGAVMILSSAGHSLLGWKLLGAELVKANAGGELIQSLGLGWHFAGAAMLAFGLVVVALFRARLKGARGSVTPAIVIGATYVLYGGWALAVSGFDPFFLVFVVPGLMVLFASLGPRNTSAFG